ncbi:hypothetical protein HN51_057754 [Arachis hypogaea]
MSFHSPWTALANALKKLLLLLRGDSDHHLPCPLPTCIEVVSDFFHARIACIWPSTLSLPARSEVAAVLVWSSSQTFFLWQYHSYILIFFS